LGTISILTPNAAGGASMVTTGEFVYPLPADNTKTSATLSPLKMALAIAPEPPPPLSVTDGSLEYPDPPVTTVMAVT
jgi:hypothetical protein